jgi:hypothetical protein
MPLFLIELAMLPYTTSSNVSTIAAAEGLLSGSNAQPLSSNAFTLGCMPDGDRLFWVKWLKFVLPSGNIGLVLVSKSSYQVS